MTTIQKSLAVVLIAAAIAAGWYQARRISQLRAEVGALKAQQLQLAALTNQVRELQRERDGATNTLAALVEENAALKKGPSDVLRLRGEVGRLQRENISISSSSALSKVTANPEARKTLRGQQKMGMTMIYKGLGKQLNLTPDQTEKLNDLLADNVMSNVDHITTVLRDKPAPEQIQQLFAAQDAALSEQVKELLGAEGLAQYQDYTRNLASSLTAEQFKGKLTGDDAAKAEKSKQLLQAMQEEVLSALAAAGLPPDYQVVPMLNFANIASEEQGERSLKLLDDIYQRVATRGNTFLNAEELAAFQEFRAAALKNSRAAFDMNRIMMAPIAK